MILAEGRDARPRDLAPDSGSASPPEGCPFCPGSEAETPPEILRVPAEGGGWSVRVVGNKFPALADGTVQRRRKGIYGWMSGVGAHEVVIESPRHDASLGDLEGHAVRDVLWACRERLRALLQRPSLEYVQIFENHGSAAGASLAHPHAQIIATAILPETMARELESFRLHRRAERACLLCSLMAQERREQERLVAGSGAFLAWTPYASRFPFEVCLGPSEHAGSFADLDDAGLADLAEHLLDVLGRLRRCLADPPYNLVVHTAPRSLETPVPDYHWHVEVLPRLARVAGFEQGTGLHINPVPPEEAARLLREAD